MDITSQGKMQRGHYSFVTLENRKYFAGVYDSPIDLNIDWVSGPEMDYHVILQSKGPHHDGFYFSNREQGISFMINGDEVRYAGC